MTHPAMTPQKICVLIDESPMNAGADGREWLHTDGNFAFDDGAGNVLLFEQHAAGLYEFHWLRATNGARRVIKFTQLCADVMFAQHNAGILYGLVPTDRRDSKLMARWIGAEKLDVVATEKGPCEMYILTRAMRATRQ